MTIDSEERREQRRHYQKQYHKQYKEEHKHPCPICGVLINQRSIFCHRHQKLPRGPECPAWKGGRMIHSGYVRVYAPNHPRAIDRHVYEHILNWEKANNKLLPDGWVIHHLNGIRNDNRVHNLVALPNRKHLNLIMALHKRIQELEALLNNQHQLL